jgi:hypothetical protein
MIIGSVCIKVQRLMPNASASYISAAVFLLTWPNLKLESSICRHSVFFFSLSEFPMDEHFSIDNFMHHSLYAHVRLRLGHRAYRK